MLKTNQKALLPPPLLGLLGVIVVAPPVFIAFNHPAYAWFLIPAPITVIFLAFAYLFHKRQQQIPSWVLLFCALVWVQAAVVGIIFTYNSTSQAYPYLLAVPVVLWCVRRYVLMKNLK